MKKGTGNIAVSEPQGKPWLASKTTASEACLNLGASSRLPTNAEWNAVALEIYNQDENWTKGRFQKGELYEGAHLALSEPLPVNNLNNPYDGTGSSSGSERRTLTLTQKGVLWDFAGNAWEWVSDTIYGSSYKPDLSGLGVLPYHNNKWEFPAGSRQLWDFTGLSSVPHRDMSLGQFFGGSSGKVLRGGAVGLRASGVSGIFAANIGDISANEMQAPASWKLNLNNVGFRCITLPK